MSRKTNRNKKTLNHALKATLMGLTTMGPVTSANAQLAIAPDADRSYRVLTRSTVKRESPDAFNRITNNALAYRAAQTRLEQRQVLRQALFSMTAQEVGLLSQAIAADIAFTARTGQHPMRVFFETMFVEQDFLNRSVQQFSESFVKYPWLTRAFSTDMHEALADVFVSPEDILQLEDIFIEVGLVLDDVWLQDNIANDVMDEINLLLETIDQMIEEQMTDVSTAWEYAHATMLGATVGLVGGAVTGAVAGSAAGPGGAAAGAATGGTLGSIGGAVGGFLNQAFSDYQEWVSKDDEDESSSTEETTEETTEDDGTDPDPDKGEDDDSIVPPGFPLGLSGSGSWDLFENTFGTQEFFEKLLDIAHDNSMPVGLSTTFTEYSEVNRAFLQEATSWQFTAMLNPVTPVHPTDINADGFKDNADITGYIGIFLDASVSADFNRDGFNDNADISSFINLFIGAF